MVKVFLGGTCSNSKWRDELIPMLKVDYFNPVVKKWTKEAKELEDIEKQNADFNLYVITRSYSMYSVAEAVDDSNKKPGKTIFMYMNEENKDKDSLNFSNCKRLNEIGKIIESNGGKYCSSLEEVANYLNSFIKK